MPNLIGLGAMRLLNERTRCVMCTQLIAKLGEGINACGFKLRCLGKPSSNALTAY